DDVDREHPAPIAGRGFEPFQNERSGVIHQDIDSSKSTCRLSDCVANAGLVGYVGANEESVAAIAGNRARALPACGFVDIEYGDTGAFLGKQIGSGLAYSSGAASYDRDFISQAHRVSTVNLRAIR